VIIIIAIKARWSMCVGDWGWFAVYIILVWHKYSGSYVTMFIKIMPLIFTNAKKLEVKQLYVAYRKRENEAVFFSQ
jgi:hypothetical protein